MKALKVILILALLSGLGWYGWKKLQGGDAQMAAGAPGAMGMAMGPMPVPVMTLQSQAAQQWLEFPGTLVAVDTVEIRPRVNGAIQKIYFNPGDIVKKDEPLFLIDPRPYQAEVERARGVLTGAQAQLALSQTELERAERLISENAIAQRDLQSRQNTQRVAKASVETAAAAVHQAELNLQYATIRAPVRGKISRAEITLGNLVSPTTAMPLATVVSIDSIYADFDVDEQTYVKMVRQQSHGDDQSLPVKLTLNTDDSVVYEGHIVSFDNKLDAASGTIRARAIFANKDQALMAGMFAKIKLGQSQPDSMILIPDALVNTDQDKKFVYIVGADNKIEYRPVTLGGISNDKRIILSGLQAGDKIVTDGLQRLRPGVPVIPQEAGNDAVAVPQEEPAAIAPVAAEPEQSSTHGESLEGTAVPVEDKKETAAPEKQPVQAAPAAKAEKPVKTEAMPAPKTLQDISAEIKKEAAADAAASKQ